MRNPIVISDDARKLYLEEFLMMNLELAAEYPQVVDNPDRHATRLLLYVGKLIASQPDKPKEDTPDDENENNQ